MELLLHTSIVPYTSPTLLDTICPNPIIFAVLPSVTTVVVMCKYNIVPLVTSTQDRAVVSAAELLVMFEVESCAVVGNGPVPVATAVIVSYPRRVA
jgi:hypothetical protein